MLWCSWVGAGGLVGRDVVVYRLITCGTVEEKIYRRQVFKGGLSRAGTRDEEQLRYFSYVVCPWHSWTTSALYMSRSNCRPALCTVSP